MKACTMKNQTNIQTKTLTSVQMVVRGEQNAVPIQGSDLSMLEEMAATLRCGTSELVRNAVLALHDHVAPHVSKAPAICRERNLADATERLPVEMVCVDDVTATRLQEIMSVTGHGAEAVMALAVTRHRAYLRKVRHPETRGLAMDNDLGDLLVPLFNPLEKTMPL